MADPVEYLRSAFNAATTPVIPKRWTDPLADAIDSPSLERAPWEARLRGFGAGAIEGLRQQLNPLEIASTLAVPALKAVKGARSIMRVAEPTMDLIESMPPRQVMPSAGDVTDLIGDMNRNLARVPSRGARPSMPATRTTAGMRDPSMTAIGEEAMFNTGRRAANPVPQYGEGFYQEMMKRRGGRGPM